MAETNQTGPTDQMEGMDQMGMVPEGGADTGVETVAEGPAGALALGGGMLLIALAGGAYTVRKRTATR